jgi:hypothetical protein
MGIKKLFSFLEYNKIYKIYPFLDDLIKELELNKDNMIIGIDGCLFYYKYSHSYDNVLIGFYNQILKFLSHKIIPLYIFDGGTIKEKELTNNLRNNKKNNSKNKVDYIDNVLENNNLGSDEEIELLLKKKKLEKKSIKMSKDKIMLILELLDILNIPYIFSYGEGEYLATLLNKLNIIDLFLSDDTDPIPAGINKMIKFYNNSVYYLDTDIIYKKLNINYLQLLDFCILLGTDYYYYNMNSNAQLILDLIIKYKSIENIKKEFEIKEINIDLINKIRDIYKTSPTKEKELFLNPENEIISNFNTIINHNDLNYYSNILLEFWDDLTLILMTERNDNSIILKKNIIEFIKTKKFNIKNIIKFFKNNIDNLSDEEINNTVISLEYLNAFGF